MFVLALSELRLSDLLVPFLQGDYSVELKAEGKDGAELLCMVVQFRISPPSLTSVLRGDSL